jgi:hypothetical protein
MRQTHYLKMSKTIVAKLLLALYLAVSCRPALPVLADVVAHVLFYEHHIATVHQHDGHFHVHEEVAAATKEDTGRQEKAPTSSNAFKIKDLAAHDSVIVAGLEFSTVGTYTRRVEFFYIQKRGSEHTAPPTPPPNFSSKIQAAGRANAPKSWLV